MGRWSLLRPSWRYGIAILLLLGVTAKLLDGCTDERSESSANLRADIELLNGDDSEVIKAALRLGSLGERAAPAVPYLIQALHKRSSYTQIFVDGDWFGPADAASVALVTIGKPAVEPLIAALVHKDASIRAGAAAALAKIDDPRVIEPLAEALRDGDFETQIAARDGLERRGPAAIPAVIKHLQGGSYEEQVLIAIGKPAVEPLLALTTSSDWQTRWGALRALGEIGDPRAFEPLLAALKDENKYIRRDAPKGLARLGDRRAFDPLLKVMKDTNETARYEAAVAISKLGGPRLVEEMLTVLTDRDPHSRWMAAMVLGGVKADEPRAVEALIAALDDDSTDVQSSAARALSQIGDESAIEPLLEALARKGSPRARIAEALGAFKAPRVVKGLIRALEDPDQDVQEWVFLSLGRIGDPSSVEAILPFVSHEAWSIRFAAACALADIADPRAARTLASLLYDPGDEDVAGASVVEEARRGLAKLGPKAVPAVLEACSHENPKLRMAAVRFLADAPDAVVVEKLISMLEDEDGNVVAAVLDALQGMTGKSIGPDRNKWQEWWVKNQEGWRPAEKGLFKGLFD